MTDRLLIDKVAWRIDFLSGNLYSMHRLGVVWSSNAEVSAAKCDQPVELEVQCCRPPAGVRLSVELNPSPLLNG